MTLIVVIALLVVWSTLDIFLLIYLGVILGIFLHRTGCWAASTLHIGHRWGTGLVGLLLVAAAAATLVFLAPRVADQLHDLAEQLPGSWENLKDILNGTRSGEWLISHMPSMEQIYRSLGGLMHRATAWLYSAVGALLGVLIVLVLGVYLALDGRLYVTGIRKLVPQGRRRLAARTLDGIGSALFWWLIGRFVSMTVVGLLTLLALVVLGVPLALSLSLFAAAMSFVPNIGPIVALVPAALLGLQEGWETAVWVVAVYTAIQTVESYLITPMVQRRMVAMPPALILSAQLVMGVIQGALGILVATPLVVAITVMTKLLYLEPVLEDHRIEIQAEKRDGV